MGGTYSFNPWMRVPEQPGVELDGLTGRPVKNPINSPRPFMQFAAQREVDTVAWHDGTLAQLASDRTLNRDEFVALSARQNELASMSGQFAQDGVIDEYERGRLNSSRSAFQEDLADYRVGDEHPVTGQGVQDRQAAFLYDQIQSGRLTREQALALRMQMSGANFANGREQVDGSSTHSRVANAEARLAEVWESLGTGQARPPRPVRQPWPPAFSGGGLIRVP